MLISRILKKHELRCVKYMFYQGRNLTAQPSVEVRTDFTRGLPALESKKPKREPFAKNLFLGKIDYEFLAYPEPQSSDRFNEFEDLLQSVKNFMKTVNPNDFEEKNSIPPYIIQKFKELGIFGARISEEYKGMGLLDTEFLRILECVSVVPALAMFLLKQTVPSVNILNSFGSVEQKLKYLPKIASGEAFVTVTVTNEHKDSVAKNLNTSAILSDCEKYWILNGSKALVSNAKEADTFIVFAFAQQCGFQERAEIVSSFLVDKNTHGLSVIENSNEKIGLKGFNTAIVTLKDVKIPKDNIIGKVGDGSEQLVNLFLNERHYIGAITIGILQNLLNLIREEVLHTKKFDRMLYTTAAAQGIISNTICTIYAIQSVLYLTSSMMDIYENQDTELECGIVDQFCVQECFDRVNEVLWLIGPQVCLNKGPYEKLYRDTFTLSHFETSLVDTKIYTALSGLQHFGLHMAEAIRQNRNPLMFPLRSLKLMFKKNHLNLEIEGYVHHVLKNSAITTERALFKLTESAEMLLTRHGAEIPNFHLDLLRISDIAALIYVYISVLSRASRSYCIGNRHSEEELRIAGLLAYKMYNKISHIFEEIDLGTYNNGDWYVEQFSEKLLREKDYYLSHPLQRNY